MGSGSGSSLLRWFSHWHTEGDQCKGRRAVTSAILIFDLYLINNPIWVTQTQRHPSLRPPVHHHSTMHHFTNKGKCNLINISRPHTHLAFHKMETDVNESVCQKVKSLCLLTFIKIHFKHNFGRQIFSLKIVVCHYSVWDWTCWATGLGESMI